jgi:hypothetical protein
MMRSTDTQQSERDPAIFLAAVASLASAKVDRLLEQIVGQVEQEMRADGVSQYRLGEAFAQEIAREIRSGGYDCTALPEGDGTWRIYAENAEPWEQEPFDIAGDR